MNRSSTDRKRRPDAVTVDHSASPGISSHGDSVSVDAEEFARRRQKLLKKMGKGGVAIIAAAPVKMRNREVEHPYRQDSSFLYLTGFPEPHAIAVLVAGRPEGEYILFCRKHNPEVERWCGRYAGQDGACRIYGADVAFAIDQVDKIMPGLLEKAKRVFHAMGYQSDLDTRLTDWLNEVRKRYRTGAHTPVDFVALDHVLNEMRLIKNRAEIDVMRHAARVTTAAHRRAMRLCRPGMTEFQIEAELRHEFMYGGCRETAYPPIVASGNNSCVLHYTANDAELRDGDLLLIDAGAEHQGYAADVTRTFPVSGRFSKEQRAIYEIVLAAQHAAIRQVRPGNPWNAPHDAAVRTLTRGLVELGLLKGDVTTLIRQDAYRKFYMHRTGHWLGLDVHDVGDYKTENKWRQLKPGMVLTVEPGLYIPSGTRGVAKKWWKIGIRIEDDVLVTRAGNQVLTEAAPKTVDDIEALMAAGGR
ncbi:MAG: Xaa-Pro aminopeptidase [Gammaproteobacteria bacterium]|nr:MAG: Xaa-Pro aminopeptidase [Gammaproteobacteria bacterium]TND04021.1 MAG: Xaa-Pro aminopeptidase [Gammaproteobacteria bacterium]